MTVSQRITNRMPELETEVSNKVPAYAAAKAQAITTEIAVLWGAYAPGAEVPATVDGLGDLVEQYVADMALIQLVPLIAGYITKLKLSETLAPQNASLGAQTVSYYNRLDALRADIEDVVTPNTERLRPMVSAMVRVEVVPPMAPVRPPIPTVRQRKGALVDPDAAWNERQGRCRS